GVVELAGLSVRPHRREDLITKITACGIEFTEPRLWLECLNVWMDGDREMIHFLKRLCGMSLFGEVTEHILPIHHGDGRNGKSTCLGTIQSILGDYATTLPIQVLLHQERTSSGPTPELAELKGMRFVTSVEPDEGVRLAEGLIKQLTGDDPIKARYLHRNPIEFNPSHTIHLAVNRLPQIRGRDRGIWRRVKKIPWVVEIPEHKQDKRLKHKLRDEWPRILGWLVEGAAEYHADGLQPPRKVLEATGEYESREDIVGRFLAACCSTGEGLWVYAGDLYRAYERWAEGAEAVLSQAKFGRAMTELGFRRSKSAVGGRTTYEGVGLLATGAEP
ncbi:MAG TPA: DNA primase, partial [Acidobacteria bacterium]|nr:DNA primase [Acidobacteriota bacterium]